MLKVRLRLRSWRQKIKQHPVIAVFVCVGSVLGIALIVVVILGYRLNWHWTGFVPETSEPKQHAKTLWDWLGLLAALAIPVVVGFGVAWFTAQQAKVNDRENTDNQREVALQAYIDKISELLLEKQLRKSAEGNEVRNIARVRTLTVLRRLDAERKGSVLRFLYEFGLIHKGQSVIDLSEADLSEADLSRNISWTGKDFGKGYLRGANLSGADLSGAKLIEAELSSTVLSEADLSKAVLLGARLRGANLSRAKLRGADLDGADLLLADLSSADLS